MQNGGKGQFLSFPHFFKIMMRVGTEDQELGRRIGLFSCFLLAGGVVWAGSSGSCGVLDGAFTVAFQGGFGEIDIPGGTTG
jgi:hypothetical protein